MSRINIRRSVIKDKSLKAAQSQATLSQLNAYRQSQQTGGEGVKSNLDLPKLNESQSQHVTIDSQSAISKNSKVKPRKENVKNPAKKSIDSLYQTSDLVPKIELKKNS